MKNIIINASLKNKSSFHTDTYTKYLYKVNNIYNLYKIYDNFYNIPFIIIGNGTNTIFLKNFIGLIIINNIKNIMIKKKNKYYYFHISSGININDLILYSIKNNIYGLENFAMIPGKIGAASIFNIGAYGIEIKDICEYVDILDIFRRKIIRLYKNKCRFKYRDSYLSKLNYKKYIIMYLGLKIPIKWKPILNYKKLNYIKNINLNSKFVYNYICNLRKNTIPNHNKKYNVGSFFKNVIIDKNKFNKIKSKYNNIPYKYISKYKIKISTGWLIDKCNLKGFKIGNVYVCNNNASIIINLKSSNNDLIFLIKFICYKIYIAFNIKLFLEVSMYSSHEKINFYDIY